MMDEIQKLCRHSRLQAIMKFAEPPKQDVALVRCKSCHFTIEVTGHGLTEAEVKLEFNAEVKKALRNPTIFLARN